MIKLIKIIIIGFVLTGCVSQNYKSNQTSDQNLIHLDSQINKPKTNETYNYPLVDTKDNNTNINQRFLCSNLSNAQAIELYKQGHTYLDRDGDGKPCEQERKGVIQPIQQKSNCHQVSGYTRKNGTYVRGYTRCR